MRRSFAGAAGFTLVEILVVVTILGILATIVVIKANNHIKLARIQATRATIQSIATAISNYEMQIGQYLPDLNDLVKEGDEDWPGPFLESEQVPRDAWGSDFKYEIRGKRVRITSAGPDRQPGTPDDIWNS